MKNNLKIYQQSIKENIRGIETILKNLGINKQIPISLYENILNQSAARILSKWSTGKKYCRTNFVQKAFGKLYPDKYTQISLCIDAMVNILDDFFDESLDKQTKSEYILEFLRVFSIYNHNSNKYILKSGKIQQALEKYFNKLTTLAIAENFYQKQIAVEKNIDKITKNSADLLICRGMDIDVFIEIALLELKHQRSIHATKEIGRLFRAVNILKKDIRDIPYDQQNNLETIVTLVSSKNKNNFPDYINNLLTIFSKRLDLIMKPINKLNRKKLHLLPIYNFNQMIQREKKEILRII